ncbi:MAG: hypothetical protein LBL96_09220 [Clostridiales bacterium]|jgi:hypothetical protein|nr:hypothetical protein [Clostridiales bacterium]
MKKDAKTKRMTITVYRDGKIICPPGDITALHLKDEVVISKSIEFYNDPEPCFIHRGAVCNRLYEEIYAALRDAFVMKNVIDSADLPEKLRVWLDIKEPYSLTAS